MPRMSRTEKRFAYDLICFDSSGRERTDDPDGLMSDAILRKLAADDSGITDVFLMCHGWKPEHPGCRDSWHVPMSAAKVKLSCPSYRYHHLSVR